MAQLRRDDDAGSASSDDLRNSSSTSAVPSDQPEVVKVNSFVSMVSRPGLPRAPMSSPSMAANSSAIAFRPATQSSNPRETRRDERVGFHPPFQGRYRNERVTVPEAAAVARSGAVAGEGRSGCRQRSVRVRHGSVALRQSNGYWPAWRAPAAATRAFMDAAARLCQRRFARQRSTTPTFDEPLITAWLRRPTRPWERDQSTRQWPAASPPARASGADTGPAAASLPRPSRVDAGGRTA